MEIIDADGHVNERADPEGLARYMPEGNRSSPVFPVLDHLHFNYLKASRNRGGVGNPDAGEWIEFLDKTGIARTILYPTAGLSSGRFVDAGWAIAACGAYNNWLCEKFLSRNPRLQGMALLPIQDADAAAAELDRAVRQLGMLGGMLPSNGEGIQGHLGAKAYWPLYEKAEKLGCSLAVHVGALHHLGMDAFNTFFPVHAIGHPVGIMIQAAAMVFHGVFDRFPKLRVGFLEGGSAWVPFFLDRLDRSQNDAHLQVGLDGELVGGPKEGEKASEYFRRQMREGRVFVGFDVDEEGLSYAVNRSGREGYLFGSDFPHEVFNAETCRREIEELMAREDLTQADKEAVLSGNARRFYRLEEIQ
jgi:predicted TIM-barrel fold metal-dependent hydrolase